MLQSPAGTCFAPHDPMVICLFFPFSAPWCLNPGSANGAGAFQALGSDAELLS